MKDTTGFTFWLLEFCSPDGLLARLSAGTTVLENCSVLYYVRVRVLAPPNLLSWVASRAAQKWLVKEGKASREHRLRLKKGMDDLICSCQEG